MKNLIRVILILLLAGCYSEGFGPDTLGSKSQAVNCVGSPYIEWEGQCIDPTGTDDFAPSLQVVVDSLPTPLPHEQRPPQRIDLPEGADLRFVSTVRFETPVALYGNGSRILPDDGVTAIVASSPGPTYNGAGYSLFEDIWVQGTGKTNEGVALDVRVHGVHVNRATCLSMEACFIVRGQYGEDGGNASAQRWSNIVARSCGSAIHVSGSDAQVGLFSGIEVLGCDTGIVDNSSFGNVWVGLSTEGVNGQGFRSDYPVSYVTVIGGYQEQGEILAHIEGPSALVVGGNLPAKLDSTSRADRIGMQSASLSFKRGGPSVKIPGNGNGDVLSWNWQSGTTSNGYTVYEPIEYRLTYDEDAVGWSFWHGGPKSGIPQNIYGGTRALTLFGYSAAEIAGALWIHRADHIGTVTLDVDDEAIPVAQ